ncbi:hypothetical protein VM98_33350, partial [Streptomyces rubellomurinus subsp. indigoferus]
MLIPGGTATLGALVARPLVDAPGPVHLLLVRRPVPLPDRAEQLAAALADAGRAVAAELWDPPAPAVPSAEPPDLAPAAVWGAVRPAQAEHPGRFVLVDLDGAGGHGADAPSLRALPGLLGGAEPQYAVRAGRILLPRLARPDPVEAAHRGPL